MAVEKSPIEWAKTPLQKYTDFSSRAPRAEYWWYTLGVIIAEIVTMLIDGIIGINVIGPYGLLTTLLVLALIVPGLAVTVRRLHDTSRSGWWILLPLVPYCLALVLAGPAMMSGSAAGLGTAGILLMIGGIGAIVLLIFMILPGNTGANAYGPDPYGEDVEKVFA